MRKFDITVNGNNYVVEVEEVECELHNQNITSIKTNTNYKCCKNKKATTPIPGTVIDIKVSVGQKVSKGDVLLIIETMKMENEIKSLINGEIKSIEVSNSSIVKQDDVIATYK